jgi:predicted TIM-barrel fold metal-dependent hydrolase
MGSHALWRDAEELLLGLPLYIDTSYSHYMLGDEGMARMIKKHGAENVLFGSDSPWTHAGREIDMIERLDLPTRTTGHTLPKRGRAAQIKPAAEEKSGLVCRRNIGLFCFSLKRP